MAQLATRTWGNADADGRSFILLVHGITSSSRTWWQVGPALAERGYQVLAVDLRGHGGSPRIEDGLGLADLAADVAETVHTTVGGPVELLVGHSLGALVALELLKTGNGLAQRLALEDPPGPSAIDWVGLAGGIEQDGTRARTDPDALRRQLVAENPTWPSYEVERQVADLSEMDATAIAAALRRSQGMTYDLAALATTATVPTLLLLGEEPLGSNLLGADRTAFIDALPNRTTHVLPAGHSVHREAFPQFMATLDTWFAAA